jgi:hypothetical protein
MGERWQAIPLHPDRPFGAVIGDDPHHAEPDQNGG